jgi:hypothetical protein
MALTRDFRDTARARAERDPLFRRALFQDAIEALLKARSMRAAQRCGPISTRPSALSV